MNIPLCSFQGLNETYNAKVSQDRERNFKEKSKIEKELKIMTKRAEKAELELIKAESVKSVQNGPGEALLQDVFGNLKEFIDGQLQCSICNEIFVYSSGKLIGFKILLSKFVKKKINNKNTELFPEQSNLKFVKLYKNNVFAFVNSF